MLLFKFFKTGINKESRKLKLEAATHKGSPRDMIKVHTNMIKIAEEKYCNGNQTTCAIYEKLKTGDKAFLS